MNDLLDIHRTLLAGTAEERYAGVVRTDQNWIGGRGLSPADATFVPAPEDRVRALLEDLVTFVALDDLPAIAQAAVAHAQFETIHPFGDGNGRAGRCLIHVVLRRRGLTPLFVPPISVVLAATGRRYIAGLVDFREGRVDDWIGAVRGRHRHRGRGGQATVGPNRRPPRRAWSSGRGRPGPTPSPAGSSSAFPPSRL